MARPKNKRRKSVVHKAIQFALVRRLLLQWICFAWTMCLASMTIQFFINPVGTQVNLDVLWGTFITNCLVSGCLLPLFIYDSVKYSHRFVGPILRLHSQLKQVGVAPVNPLQLRADDFWHEVAAEFNSMLTRIEVKQDRAEDSPCEIPAQTQDESTDFANTEFAISAR